jgi:pullulanase
VPEDVPPPSGDVSAPIFARGTLTDPQWDALTLELTKVAENRYEVVVPGLTAATTYQLKIASENWSTHNWGGSAAGVDLTSGISITLATPGENINLVIATAGAYKLILDTSNLQTPGLTLEAQ